MKWILKCLLVIIILSFESQANGQWKRLNEPFDGKAIATIKVIEDKIYAGTSNLFPKPDKLYESSDSGQNWIVIDSIYGYNDEFIQFASLGNVIFVVRADSGIYKTTDNGETLSQIFHIPESNSKYYLFTIIDTVLIAATDGQLYQSTDTGTTWNLTYDGSWHNPIKSLMSYDNRVFAGIFYGLLISTDQGLNWSESKFSTYEMGSLIDLLAIDTLIFATNGSRVYKSSDNGINWTNITSNLSINSFKICLGTCNNNLLISTQYGVFKTTTNSRSWFNTNLGLDKTLVYGFDILGDYLFAATNNGVYRIDTSQIASLPCDFITVGAYTDPPSCPTCLDGTATAYAESGFPPFTYIWYTSPIQTTQTAYGLSRAYYKYCITDSTGCIGCDSIFIDKITGTNVMSKELSFQVFPNPVTTNLIIGLPTNGLKHKIEIYSIVGELKYSSIISCDQNNIDVSKLISGIYILQITAGDEIERQKFIKQ